MQLCYPQLSERSHALHGSDPAAAQNINTICATSAQTGRSKTPAAVSKTASAGLESAA